MTERQFRDLIGGKIELHSFDILCPIIQHCNYGVSPENSDQQCFRTEAAPGS